MSKEKVKKEKKFDFWQDHSLHYLEMALKADNRARIENPDGYGKNTYKCGDTVEMFLSITDNRIKHISFDSNGCMNIIACANTVIHLAEGKTAEQAGNITPGNVVDYLETLPEHEIHCAELALEAFFIALTDTK